MVKNNWADGDTVHGSDLNAVADAVNVASVFSSGAVTGLTVVLPASTDFVADSSLEISSDSSVEIPSTSTLDVYAGTVAVLTNPTVKNYTENVVSIGIVSSSCVLNLTDGTVQMVTLTASTACTFTMPQPVAGKSFVLLVKQAAVTGSGTATFTAVKWAAAGAPTITAAAGSMDIITFIADGSNWYGSYSQGYTP